MKIDINNLTKAINNLTSDLRISGKPEVADEFDRQLSLLQHPSSNEEFRFILEQIKNCSAVSQYADFSYEQDRLLKQVITLCIALLENISMESARST